MDGERVSKFPLCRNQVAIINQLHREECRDDETCKRVKIPHTGSMPTSNIICINLDRQFPTSGYVLQGCQVVVPKSKEQSTNGFCVVKEFNGYLYSHLYLDIYIVAPGKYYYDCLYHQGSVLTYEVVTYSKADKIQDLTIVIDNEVVPVTNSIKLREGVTLSVVFRVFGIWSVYSPQCHPLRDHANGRIQCRFNYPCNSEILGGRDPAATFIYYFNTVKLSDSGTRLTFHGGNRELETVIITVNTPAVSHTQSLLPPKIDQ
ncbi:uncharacterized protein [Dysidea avara]|uniref:uncharacterized protein n=1 Tax=Dysidea avara TaxID=196820 RepID=UPI00332BBDC0